MTSTSANGWFATASRLTGRNTQRARMGSKPVAGCGRGVVSSRGCSEPASGQAGGQQIARMMRIIDRARVDK